METNPRLSLHKKKEKEKPKSAADSEHYKQEGIASFTPPPFRVTATPIQHKEEDTEKENGQEKKKNARQFADSGDADSTVPPPSGMPNGNPVNNIIPFDIKKTPHYVERPAPKPQKPYNFKDSPHYTERPAPTPIEPYRLPSAGQQLNSTAGKEESKANNIPEKGMTNNNTTQETGAGQDGNAAPPNSGNTAPVNPSNGATNTGNGEGNQATAPSGQSPEASAEEAAEFSTKVDTSSSEAYIKSLTQNPPSGFIKGVSEAGEAVPGILQKEKDDLKENQPEIEQPTGLLTKEAKAKEEAAASPEIDVVPLAEEKDTEQPKTEEIHPVPSGELAQFPTPQPQETVEGEEDPNLKQNIKNALSQLPTSDPNLNTSAGKRKQIDLTGKANPAQIDKNKLQYKDNVENRAALADKETEKDFGENDIFPELETEMLKTELETKPILALQVEPIEIPEVQGDLLAHFDVDAKTHLDEQTAEHLTKHEEAATKRDEDSEETKLEKMEELDTETERIKKEQETAQGEAKTEVSKQRKNWRAENQALRDEYDTKSKKERDRIDQEINSKVAETDKQVETELSNAEKQADEKRREADGKAAKKKADAENEESGFWGWVGKKLSQALDALKDAVNYIFDQLRKAVKAIIETAKKLVNGLIELARKAIVGLIKAFGEFLKALVSTLLAAFPELAKKINGYIDAAVNKAVEVVNQLAEALKKIASAILDFLGKALDAILSVFQAIYATILTGLSMIASGKIKEILVGLANLGRAIAAFPGQFMGALSEEALGTDLSNPIPNIERTDTENEQFAAQYGNQAATMPTMPEAATSEPSLPSMENDALANKQVLSDQDVQLNPSLPVEIDPALLASLNLADGETMELGGSPNPVTTESLKAEAFGEAPSMEPSSMPEIPTAEPQAQAPAAAGNGPNWLGMSDDQKLDYYIGEMGKEEGEPNAKDTSKPATVQGTPIIAKTGKLSVGQRMSFAGRQMLAGMKSWFMKNQAAIYASVAGILLVGGIVAFFTGGAGLMALVPVLLKVLMAFFIADALVRAKGHFADFFKKGWAGDAQGGGKALAKAMSVIISEFVFEYVLRGVGKVLKRVRDTVKASRTFNRVTKTMGKGAKALNRTPGIGHAMRGANRARKATVSGGKFVINRIRKGTGRGAKKLGDFRRKVLGAFGFKRLWLEKHGKYVELWGKFNSQVLLMKQDADGNRIVEVDSKSIKRSEGQKLLGEQHTVKGNKGYVVADSNNGYARKLEGMSDAELDDMYKKLDEVDDLAARRKIVSSSTGKSTHQLGKGIEAVDGKIPKGFQRHHILPEEVAYDPDFEKFLKDIKFDPQNGKINGVALPKNQAILDDAIKNGYKHKNPTFHNGSHIDSYKEPFRKKLKQLKRQYDDLLAKNDPKAVEKIGGKLEKFLAKSKRELLQGKTKLNKPK